MSLKLQPFLFFRVRDASNTTLDWYTLNAIPLFGISLCAGLLKNGNLVIVRPSHIDIDIFFLLYSVQSLPESNR